MSAQRTIFSCAESLKGSLREPRNRARTSVEKSCKSNQEVPEDEGESEGYRFREGDVDMHVRGHENENSVYVG